MNLNQVQSCVLYARLSVTKEESVSIARQLKSCRSYAEARGWVVVGEFIDDGVSATANRPEERKGWAALLAAHGFDAVIIWKVDRLARRVLDFLHADETLQARGAGLVAVDDPIDMTSPQGRAFAVMLAVFGEMEAEATRARVQAARKQILAEGRWPGGGVPYGYQSVPNPNGPGRVLVKNPETIAWLTQVVTKALAGEAVNAIARWLTKCGAPSPGRNASDSGADYVWHRQTVDGLLRNPVLAGMTPCNPGRGRSGRRVDPFAVVRDSVGNPVVTPESALITVEQFAELQQLLEDRTSPQARKREDRVVTSEFLAKVALCDACEVVMYRGTNQGKAMLYCPKCRQTLSRGAFDQYLGDRLLAERGDEPVGDSTVRDRWERAGTDAGRRREVLLSQLANLRIRRGVVGRRFDAKRVLLDWLPSLAAPSTDEVSV